MKRVFLALLVLVIMAYGAFLSFNYDSQPVASSGSSNLSGLGATRPESAIDSTIAALVLPLHSDSREERQEALRELSLKTSPQRIIVAVADEEPTEEILVYSDNWKAADRKVQNDKNVLETLISENYAIANTEAFLKNDNIPLLISDIFTFFDKASYSALLISSGVSQKDIQKLAGFLYAGDEEAMVIAASDFANGLPESLVTIHTKHAYQSLAGQKMDSVWKIDTAVPGAVSLASEFAKNASKKSFHVVGTERVIAYWDDAAAETIERTSSFIIAGDAMFDRNVWHNYKDLGLEEIFSNLPPNLFKGTDLAMLNLEGPISAKPINDDYKSGSMVFNFPPVVPEVLKILGINTVSLANNHTFNAGASGFANTQGVLSAAGIAHFGRERGFDPKEDVIRLDSGLPLSLIGLDALAKYDEKAFVTAIKSEKQEDRFVIVVPHWGEEYKSVHNTSQRTLAKKWIAAGADLIVGSHPHVVQDFEIIDNVPVVYSLGNFVFDQYFSDETQRGLIIAGTVSEKSLILSFLPTKSALSRPQLLEGTEKATAISKVFDIDSSDGFIKISDDTIEITR